MKAKVPCYRRVCESTEAVYFNLSTRQMYCEQCAKKINEANREDAMGLYGQDLCTRVIPKEKEDEIN